MQGYARLSAFIAKTTAQSWPSQICPIADFRQNEQANGQNHAQQSRVFDEGNAALVFMEVADEFWNSFHN